MADNMLFSRPVMAPPQVSRICADVSDLPLYGVRMAVEPDPELDRRVLMAAGGPAQGEEHQHRVVEKCVRKST